MLYVYKKTFKQGTIFSSKIPNKKYRTGFLNIALQVFHNRLRKR